MNIVNLKGYTPKKKQNNERTISIKIEPSSIDISKIAEELMKEFGRQAEETQKQMDDLLDQWAEEEVMRKRNKFYVAGGKDCEK